MLLPEIRMGLILQSGGATQIKYLDQCEPLNQGRLYGSPDQAPRSGCTSRPIARPCVPVSVLSSSSVVALASTPGGNGPVPDRVAFSNRE